MHFWKAKFNTNKNNTKWFSKNKLVGLLVLTEQKAYHADNFRTDKHSTMIDQGTTQTTPTYILTSPSIALLYQKQTNTSMQPTSTHIRQKALHTGKFKPNKVTLFTENKSRQKGIFHRQNHNLQKQYKFKRNKSKLILALHTTHKTKGISYRQIQSKLK